jgi:hypothetical protein
VRGCLLLFDLGDYRFHLFDRIDAHGGYFLTRAKSNFNPLITAVHRRWRGRSIDVVGQRLGESLPRLQRAVLDIEAEVQYTDATASMLDGPLVLMTMPSTRP